MTKKGMEEHKSRQMNAREGKLSQLTSMIKLIEELMADDTNADLVKNKQFMSEEEFLENQKELV